jgi:hypothetical protein
MNLQAFIREYTGKRPAYKGGYPGECLSLVKLWIEQTYNISPPASGVGSAYGYWTNFPDPLGTVFEKIPNTKDGVIKEGDIPVWKKSYGGYGHIAIGVQGTKDTFLAFSVNDPVGSTATVREYNYNNIYGWLRPKETMKPGYVEVPAKDFENLVMKSSRWDEVLKLGYTSAAEIEAEHKSLKQEIKNKQDEARIEKERGETYRKDFNTLLADIAKALNTTQEVNQVYAALEKVTKELDLLDDLQRQYAELDVSSKAKEEELRAEIARLKAVKSSVDDATLEELLSAIIKKLTNLLKR